MEDLKILLDGLLNMVTEIKEKSEQQAAKAEQILSALQSQSEQPAKPAGDEQTAARLKAVEKSVKALSNEQMNTANAIVNTMLKMFEEEYGRYFERAQVQIKALLDKHDSRLHSTLVSLASRLPPQEPPIEKASPLHWYMRLRQRIVSFLKPKSFLLSSVVVVCVVSLATNFRLLHRNNDLRDSDLKYRYLLMKGEADGNTMERLEKTFNWERDEDAVRQLRDTVYPAGKEHIAGAA